MPNGFFDSFKNQVLDNTGTRVDFTSETRITAFLLDHTDDTPNLATDDFLNDILAAAREELAVLTTTTVGTPAAGAFDAVDTLFSATAGDACDSILLVDDNGGAETVQPLVCMWDTAGGLPVTLGGDVTIQWDSGANRIFSIG